MLWKKDKSKKENAKKTRASISQLKKENAPEIQFGDDVFNDESDFQLAKPGKRTKLETEMQDGTLTPEQIREDYLSHREALFPVVTSQAHALRVTTATIYNYRFLIPHSPLIAQVFSFLVRLERAFRRRVVTELTPDLQKRHPVRYLELAFPDLRKSGISERKMAILLAETVTQLLPELQDQLLRGLQSDDFSEEDLDKVQIRIQRIVAEYTKPLATLGSG